METIELLREIRDNTKAKEFNLGDMFVTTLGASLGFVMALGLNAAMVKTFATIEIGGSELGGLWIYAALVIFIGMFLLYLLYAHLQPWLSKKYSALRHRKFAR